MSDILNKILAVKAEEIAAAKAQLSAASLQAQVEQDQALHSNLRGFEQAMRSGCRR
jgi:indole-3-glycerol phosphate synthase